MPPKRTARGTTKDAEDAVAAAGGASNWIEMNSMLIRNLSSGVEPSSIIHGFDMDDTLLTTASGKTFATSAADWKLWHSDVPAKVQAAHAAGAKIVIFTNQMGISKGKLTAAAFKARCDALIATLGVPVQVFAATEEDVYRKPSTRMWEYMEEHGNGTKKVDRSQSLYIGDAGGRTRNPTTGKKDFSCSDRKFAHNVGVKFNTPEMYFQGRSDDAFEWGSVDPAAAMAAQKALPLFTPATPPLVSGSVEVIVLVGFPASGKSTFSKRHLVPHGYVHVNQDTAGTKEKCVKMCREALEQKKPVVIDNTNASRDLRNLYITLAKDFGVPARCFHFQTSQDLAEHLNIFREAMGLQKHVPGVGYNMFKKNFVAPSLSEGFTEIKQVNFVPEFDNEEMRTRFLHFT